LDVSAQVEEAGIALMINVATLMKSSDPSREFADMAGKAQTIQWMAEFAQDVFRDPRE
jgi:hypothetical protein